METVPRNTILQGDALATLRTLPSRSVHCVITSPPYYALRDYGVAGQIGLEPTLQDYLDKMLAVFDEVRRVLRPDGTCWLNIGDSYANNPSTSKIPRAEQGNGTGVFRIPDEEHVQARRQRPNQLTAMKRDGLKHKDLMLVPFRLALMLQHDGWWVRSDIIWHKPSAMPESVTDRPTRAHEYLFLLTKSGHYYYDAEAVREPVTGGAHPRTAGRNSREYVDRDPRHMKMPAGWETGKGAHGRYHRQGREKGQCQEIVPGVTPKSAVPGSGIKANASFHAATTALVGSRNKRSVWTCASAPFPEHFATFPPALIEPCLLAGTSPYCCELCGAPWRRIVDHVRTVDGEAVAYVPPMRSTSKHAPSSAQGIGHRRTGSRSEHLGWKPGCRCKGNTGTGRCIVLDPFMGAGTTALVALQHDRDYLGIELNPAYIEIAERHIATARLPREERVARAAAEAAGVSVATLWDAVAVGT